MARTPEGKVKAAVKKVLDEYGVYYFSPPANGYGRVGIPDIICCVNGYFVAIECKAGKGMTTPLQNRELARIGEAGGAALVINEDGIDSLHQLITTYDNLIATYCP